MQLYLKAENAPNLLFSVLDEKENLLFLVNGSEAPFGCRFTIRTAEGSTAAKLTGLCLAGTQRFTAVQGSRLLRMRVRPDSVHRPVLFRGMPWRFRGSVVLRSFDVLEEEPHGQTHLVLTQGRCWNGKGDCYALTVPRPEDVPLAVCIAAALDYFAQNCCLAPVPTA